MSASSSDQLRQDKRAQRRNLSPTQQAQHAQRLTEQIIQQDSFTQSQLIAAYLCNDGEIDPAQIIEQAWQQNKQVYLPVLSAHENSLLFAPYESDSLMCRNQFGIDEPDCAPEYWLKAESMDLILLPLVAFDDQANRMGMGGGFYDRSLANIRQQEKQTHLIGIAHEIQQVEQLEVQKWDVPLDAIITENGIYPAQ